MSAPASGACFGVSPFWVWHLDSFLINIAANVPLAQARLNQFSNLLRRSFSAVQRGSITGSEQEHFSVF